VFFGPEFFGPFAPFGAALRGPKNSGPKIVGEKNMQNFRTYQLALELNRLAMNLKLKQPYRDQFLRAVLSVASNLAEGSAKSSIADRRRFYEIALGSFKESRVTIELLGLKELDQLADKLGASLHCLCRSLR
jgi:four helix bundle protein